MAEKNLDDKKDKLGARKEKEEQKGKMSAGRDVEQKGKTSVQKDQEDALSDMLQAKGLAQNIRQSKGASAQVKQPAYLDTYTVQSGDSLSKIAERYYGSQAREKWMAIYEANKDVIGDNPSLIFPGQELNIPDLDI